MWSTIKGEMGPLIPLGVKADLMDSHKHLRNGLYICLGGRAYYICDDILAHFLDKGKTSILA